MKIKGNIWRALFRIFQDKWDDLSYWLEEFNEKTGAWEPTGVNINDHGCQSGPLGKYLDFTLKGLMNDKPYVALNTH